MPKPSTEKGPPYASETDESANHAQALANTVSTSSHTEKPHRNATGKKKERPKSKSKSGKTGSPSLLSRNSSTSSETPLQPVFEYVPNHGPRVSIGTALCQAGFDERAVARELMQVVLQLAHPDATDRSGAKKLLVDVLKECSRQLDNSGGHRAGDAPVIVQLVHTVSRPPRAAPALTSANPGPAIDIAAPSNPDSPAAAPPTISSTEAL